MKEGEQMKEFYLWDYYEDYGNIGDYDTEASFERKLNYDCI